MIAPVRVLITLITIHNLHVHQIDVKTAFLNGDLDKEIYMSQHEECVVPDTGHKVCKLIKSLSTGHKVCKLIKSLYSLKQAPKYWHEHLIKY